jgi:hypothetical protein
MLHYLQDTAGNVMLPHVRETAGNKGLYSRNCR